MKLKSHIIYNLGYFPGFSHRKYYEKKCKKLLTQDILSLTRLIAIYKYIHFYVVSSNTLIYKIIYEMYRAERITVRNGTMQKNGPVAQLGR